MQAAELGPWILAAGALAVALAAIWKIVSAALRLARKVGHFLDDWNGEDARPGQVARPGIPDRLASVEVHLSRMCDRMGTVEQRTAAIEHELHPNSGASLRDAVDRIEVQLDPDQP